MAIAFAEGAVTKLRREFKLVLRAEDATSFCQRVEEELGDAPTQTRITSIYFDRPGMPLARRARLTPDDCVKVRTKEYFPDCQRELGPRVVFEVKRESNGMTRKRRVWIPRADLVDVMSARRPLLDAVGASGGLQPVVAVTYVRQVYQREESWRLTVDRDIAYHAVSEPLAIGPKPVSVDALGTALGREQRVVVEVKHLGAALPLWLEALRCARSCRYSKFAEAVAHLSGERTAEVNGG